MDSNSYFVRFIKHTLIFLLVFLLFGAILEWILEGTHPFETMVDRFPAAVILSILIGLVAPAVNSKVAYRVYIGNNENTIFVELHAFLDKLKYELKSLEGIRSLYAPSSRYRQIVTLFEDQIEIVRSHDHIIVIGYWYRIRKVINKLHELSVNIERVESSEMNIIHH